ncbi:MAG: methylated-DNA--[protein]-cysteine S-methyltransferase [Sulfurisoma sp.]|nr:methylated-DNA--[protein]-cysteine S-methyltransferase [Sulfurisoma sp.]
MDEPFAAIVPAPRFALGIRCRDDAITAIEFIEPHREVPARTPLAREAARQLRAWLADPGTAFDLPLQPSGTTFQRRVWQQIAAIPRGATRTYGELAAALHSAPRPVGGACGANPYPLVIPCHRVVAAGGLGGFARERGGFLLEVKRWLLDHERSR